MKKHELWGVIIAAFMLVLVLLGAILTFTDRMTTMEVQLTTIQRDIATLGETRIDRDYAHNALRYRVSVLESLHDALERRMDDFACLFCAAGAGGG